MARADMAVELCDMPERRHFVEVWPVLKMAIDRPSVGAVSGLQIRERGSIPQRSSRSLLLVLSTAEKKATIVDRQAGTVTRTLCIRLVCSS